MDIISFNEASTANGRIEICNANPDSTSGIVTVPKVIASGETITIPAGRVAILPNMQIDGVLNIENGGEVFIPSGATLGDLDARLALKAPLVNPAFTNPTATTQAAQDNSTKVATTAYVDGKMVLGTAVNSTSGTSIDFTGIPSWVKKITVMFSGVSLSGTSNILIKIGNNVTFTDTGYLSANARIIDGSVGHSLYTSGFFITSYRSSSSDTINGNCNIVLLGNNTYICNSSVYNTGYNSNQIQSGTKTLAGTLNKIRITTVNGTDTFHAGQINIMYEG